MRVASFAKHTVSTLATRVLGLGLGLLASVVIARVLGPDGTGTYTLATLYPTLILTFANFGIGPATVYYVAQDKYPLKEVFGSITITSVILGTISSLVGVALALGFQDWIFPQVTREYLVLALALVMLDLFGRQYALQTLLGAKRITQFNAATLASSLFFVLALVATLGLGFGIAGAIGARILSSFFLCILLFLWIRKLADGISFRLNLTFVRDASDYGIRAHLGNIVAFLNYRIELFMLGFFLPVTAIGFYSLAVGLAEKLWLVSQSASTILFPTISAEQDEDRRKAFTPLVCRNILLITVVGATVLFFASRWLIVAIYSTEYLPSVQLFRILLPGVVFLSGARILANDIAGRGKPLLNTYVGLLGLVIQVGLNLAWIPRLGAAGSAWASTASYGIILAARLWLYMRISGNSLTTIVVPQSTDLLLYRRLVQLAWRQVQRTAAHF